MNYYEFGVTTTIDWTRADTVYVKAESSHDAIKFMLTQTSDEDENHPYADFKFRTAIPECCMLNNVEILDATIPPAFVVEYSNAEQEFDWLEWWIVRMNGKIIGSIGRNTLVQEDYHFSAHADEHYGWLKTNREYSGNYNTLDKAKDAAYSYAEFLNKQ